MEEWDIYNKQRQMINKTAIRDVTELAPGEFHLIVKFIAINPKGEVLLTQRAEYKPYGLYWECGGGSIKKGETSLEGVSREAEEEVGFKVDQDRAFLLESKLYKRCIGDIWVFPQDIKNEEITFPDGESINSKWVTIDDIYKMKGDKTFSPVDPLDREMYDEAINMIQVLYPDYLK